MAARVLLIRPSFAVLRFLGSFPCLRRIRFLSTRTYHISSGGSMSPSKVPLLSFDCPARIAPVPYRRNFSIRSTENLVSIRLPLIESMEKKIKEQLSADLVIVKDAHGDGRHVSIEVISSVFEGKTAVNRQRMVYKAIWGELQDAVHAVDQMTTRTPSEAASQKL